MRLGGKDVYLGRADADPSALASNYAQAVLRAQTSQEIAWWLKPRTMRQLGEEYLTWYANLYQRRGRPSSEFAVARRAMDLLVAAELGDVPISDFGPLRLQKYQRYLAEDPAQVLARRTINRYVRVVIKAMKFAVAQQLAPASAVTALECVPELRRGARVRRDGKPLREGRKRAPIDITTQLEPVLRAARPMLAAMITAQVYSGMRPQELCELRGRYLAPTADPGVVAYHVPDDYNKTSIYNIIRVVLLGPRAMAAIRPYLTDDPDAPIFRPELGLAESAARKRESRKTPLYPSHEAEARRRRRGSAPQGVNETYTTPTYARAVLRACQAAFPYPEELRRLPEPERRQAARAWRAANWWTPGRLRHTFASAVANAENPVVAQRLLGHSSISTTMRYVTPADQPAVLAALRHG